MNFALWLGLILMSIVLGVQVIVEPSSDATRPLLMIMALALAKMIDRDEKRSGR